MKLPFQKKRDALNEPFSPDVPVQTRRSLPEHEQGLMFEATTHWGRGLAIVLGIVGTILVFLVLLTLLPKPGSGNPLESLANSFGSSNSVVVTPVTGNSAPTPAVALATAPLKVSSPGTSGTGTPTPKFVAVPSSGAPNVRSAANTNNNPIGNLAPNRQVEVIGRSPDNAWLQIIWDNNTKAWVAQELLRIIVGDASQIPVVR